MAYQRIIFFQNEQADEALKILNDDGWEAAIAHLAQWDQGLAGGEISDEPSSGDADCVKEDDHYRLSWNSGLGYIGLEAIVSDETPT
jgi:hypothetical protein